MMLGAFTKSFEDESTADMFVFSFFCDASGAPWKSKAVSFSRSNDPLCRLLGVRAPGWKKEHEAAYERANLEAMLHFNRCPVCGGWVCDTAFNEDANCCIRCAESAEPQAPQQSPE